MTDAAHIQHLKALREQNITNLRHLETQAALHGGESNIPIYLMNQLRQTLQTLNQLTAQLRKLGVTVPTTTTTMELPTTTEPYNPEQTLLECQEYILDNLDALLNTPPRALLSRVKHRIHTTFRNLDGERKGILLKFLYDEHLIGYHDENRSVLPAIISLEMADLRGMQVNKYYLAGCNLQRTQCHDAQCMGTNFRGSLLDQSSWDRANLIYANMSEAAVTGARFYKATLTGAVLHGTNLSVAKLDGADLSDAGLHGANLTLAYLSDAILTQEQLAQAETYKNALLPNHLT